MIINVDSPVPNLQDLNVNLSYTNITGTPETTAIRVLAGSAPQGFSIPVGDDDIAAQPTRTFSVTVESSGDYDVGDPSAVEINVLNNDPAVVSILPVSRSSIDEGDPAQFEVQVSNEIATTLTATISLTAGLGEDFGINLDDTDVVIVAGETRALLTVGTTGDDIDEDNGSLTATINSLTLSESVSGVQPTIRC